MAKSKVLTIDDEFRDLLPRLSMEESAQLSVSLQTEGCHHSLDVWEREGDCVLLDGHNRYDICKEHGVKFSLCRHKFASRFAAMNWIIEQQLGKRNLSPEQYSYYRGKRYNVEKKETPNPSGNNASLVGGHFDHQPKTAEKIAAETGVGEKTIRRDAEFADDVDAIGEVSPEARQAILSGEVTSTRKATEQLAELPAAQKKKAAKLIEAGKVESVKEAVAAVTKQEPSEAAEDEDNQDYVGNVIPKKCKPAFDAIKSLREFCTSCHKLRHTLAELCKQPGGEQIMQQAAAAALNNAKEGVLRSMPYAVCPYCKCKGHSCEGCKGLGWVTKLVYDQSPKEKKVRK